MIDQHQIEIIRQKYILLRPELDERARRCWAAAEATALGYGGVSAVARATGAELVWTGWYKRPNWDLQLAIALWKVVDGKATQVGQVVARGPFQDLNKMAADAIVELSEKAGRPARPEARTALASSAFDDTCTLVR